MIAKMKKTRPNPRLGKKEKSPYRHSEAISDQRHCRRDVCIDRARKAGRRPKLGEEERRGDFSLLVLILLVLLKIARTSRDRDRSLCEEELPSARIDRIRRPLHGTSPRRRRRRREQREPGIGAGELREARHAGVVARIVWWWRRLPPRRCEGCYWACAEGILLLLPLVSAERARRTEKDGPGGGGRGRARRRRSVQRVHKVVRPREVWELNIGQDGRVSATISLERHCAEVEIDKTEARGQVPNEEKGRAPKEDGGAGAGRADGGERGPTGFEDLDQRDQGHSPEGDVDGLHGCDVAMEVSVEVGGGGCGAWAW